MERVAPPPLPPKTRKAPPDRGSATVLSNCYPRQPQNHVVKIRINPQSYAVHDPETAAHYAEPPRTISISIGQGLNSDMKTVSTDAEGERLPYFYYNGYNCTSIPSGQVSPSETLDSGTCSDLDGTPPPLPKKKNSSVTVTVINGRRPPSSDLDSDQESSISYDSLNSGELPPESTLITLTTPTIVETHAKGAASGLPQGLLRDIRDRNAKLTPAVKPASPVVDERTYEERKEIEKQVVLSKLTFDADRFYDFHLNEHDYEESPKRDEIVEDETFAGYKDLLGNGDATIRSAKGTVRGVKNRVRAGIATFLQINSVARSYKEKDSGKVVVYTTTMGILRETYQACMRVKQILRQLLVKYEERDVFMSSEYQAEIKERMRCEDILVPQVFVDGQHVGDAETVERLNETGELRRILKPFKSMDVCTTCQTCGGYRLLPCSVCKGSKKSVHRNHFTAEFVALKCMNCDEVGLVKCTSC